MDNQLKLLTSVDTVRNFLAYCYFFFFIQEIFLESLLYVRQYSRCWENKEEQDTGPVQKGLAGWCRTQI